MKYLVALLILVTAYLQYQLWFERGGVLDVARLEDAVRTQREEIQRLRERNQALEAEVSDLKQGSEAIEERARSELGMIKENEVFIRVTPRVPAPAEAP
ncbi:MAG: cell division protein FtsB [Gammaproteobacteria bacterium]